MVRHTFGGVGNGRNVIGYAVGRKPCLEDVFPFGGWPLPRVQSSLRLRVAGAKWKSNPTQSEGKAGTDRDAILYREMEWRLPRASLRREATPLTRQLRGAASTSNNFPTHPRNMYQNVSRRINSISPIAKSGSNSISHTF